MWSLHVCCFFFQAEDGIRGLVRSRGLGDVYKRQGLWPFLPETPMTFCRLIVADSWVSPRAGGWRLGGCLLYTSDAADERSSVDLGGRRIIKKKKTVD